MMEASEELRAALGAIVPEKFDSLPDIGLYMDQLIDYLSRTPATLRQEGGLTGAMVNNYIKSGLLPRVSGKRYSREHIADLSMIARLKQVLSVSDTGVLLGLAREDDAEGYYDHFCDCLRAAAEELSAELEDSTESVQSLALELALESYVKKVACEYLIGVLSEQKAE